MGEENWMQFRIEGNTNFLIFYVRTEVEPHDALDFTLF